MNQNKEIISSFRGCASTRNLTVWCCLHCDLRTNFFLILVWKGLNNITTLQFLYLGFTLQCEFNVDKFLPWTFFFLALCSETEKDLSMSINYELMGKG